MAKIKILWVDDEVDLLKPHILCLTSKGYEVDTRISGAEALEAIDEVRYDIVLLDENVPGLTGLETLHEIKEKQASLPVVMITKSEEEFIMEEVEGINKLTIRRTADGIETEELFFGPEADKKIKELESRQNTPIKIEMNTEEDHSHE